MDQQTTAMFYRKLLFLAALFLWPLPGLLAAAGDTAYFRHGIASGDPLQDRVVIWTRITAEAYPSDEVNWEVSSDKEFRQDVRKGACRISPSSDYTVKADVKHLRAGTAYYYRFRYSDRYSGTGVTRTLPRRLMEDSFSMAVVSCNNWEDGYFNAFRFLAQKQDVDLVLHLGDYIYEYATGQYGDTSIGRINYPRHELVTLSDYRQRYAQYRSDPDLQQLHAAKPFLMVWDDHEIANDAYKGGAGNHQPEDGNWMTRRQAAVRAYLEWLPVRAAGPAEMRRKVSIGNDMDLLLLEERVEGRTQQVSREDPSFYDEDRSLLGSTQFEWLMHQLKGSRATWKLIGNQVMLTGYAVAEGNKPPKYNDWWLGYPYERHKLINRLQKEHIRNTVFLTGDHHESFVLALHPEDELLKYTHSAAGKPLAWEFLTPSITSRNADRLPAADAERFESMLRRTEINPHLVFADIRSHGYFIATVSEDQFRADYYFTDNLRSRDAAEHKAASFTIDAATFTIRSNEH